MKNSKTCCDNKDNHTIYVDAKGNKWLRCKICGKMLKT